MPVQSFGSYRWKSIMLVMPWVIGHSLWMVDSGTCSFWMDKWMELGILFDAFGHAPHADCYTTLKDIFARRDVFEDHVMGDTSAIEALWNEFNNLLIDPGGGEDRLMWTPTMDGCFSVKNVWCKISAYEANIMASKWIWSSLLPSKMSLLL